MRDTHNKVEINFFTFYCICVCINCILNFNDPLTSILRKSNFLFLGVFWTFYSCKHMTIIHVLSPVNDLQINPVINSVKDNFWHSTREANHGVIFLTKCYFTVVRSLARKLFIWILLHLHNYDSHNLSKDLNKLTLTLINNYRYYV